MRFAILLLVCVVGCAKTHSSVRMIAVDGARPGQCPTGEEAEFLLRNRVRGESIVRIDGGPALRRVVTCTYDVTYPEQGCPAPPQLSITREDLATCPAPESVAAALIEAHGLASSPCASIVPVKLAATTREESCVYAVTEREYQGSPSSFSWVVLH